VFDRLALVFDYTKLSKKPKPKYNDAQRAERERSLKEVCLGPQCTKFRLISWFIAVHQYVFGYGTRGKLTTQSEIFTFQGDKKQKDANRRAAGCEGSPCAGFPGESCDEVSILILRAASAI
jgi:hypothetical protein